MYQFFCWACDISKNSGEGNLANLFVNNSLKKNYIIYTPQKLNIKIKIIKDIINYKYISPLIGIIFCWLFFLKNKRVVYINYLPLWNFLIFSLLPPKTLLGPITGGAFFSKKQYFVRYFLFPFFYKISELFLLIRKNEIHFSTELLKKYLFNFTIRKSKFNYVFKYYSKKIFKKKDIDFIIYYRRHKNKEASFPFLFIKNLIRLNFKIHFVGDYFKNPHVKNHGYLNNCKINNLLSRSHFSLISNENLYTIFTIECLNNHVQIVADFFQKNKIKYFKKQFIFIDFNKKFVEKNFFEKKKINFL
jgi:hypothetical protein